MDGRTCRMRGREREIDSSTFGRSFVQVALEHQSRIIPLLHPPVAHPLASTCDHSLHTSNPQPTNIGFDFLKPPSTTNSKPSPPPRRLDLTPYSFTSTSFRPPKNSLPPTLTLPLDKLSYTTRRAPPLLHFLFLFSK